MRADLREADLVELCDVSAGGADIDQLDGGDVFFFQAEDGIRDVALTGVQTCALPIYQLLGFLPCRRHLFGAEDARIYLLGTDAYGRDQFSRLLFGGQVSLFAGLLGAGLTLLIRSEERRVGKECRSRWSPYH